MENSEEEQIISSLYKYFLKRDPGPAEFASWVKVASSGTPVSQIIESFGNCEEYKRANVVVPFWPPGHYYSPIVAPDEDVRAYMASQAQRVGTAPAAIDMAPGDMRAFFVENYRFMASAQFPQNQSDRFRYYSDNQVFPLGDALVLRTMIDVLRPRQIIEIGSGFSTACMLDTFDELAIRPKLTCIEPYPDRLRSLMRATDDVEILETPVQKVPPEQFSQLGNGDILFIDSTHVLKSGSDVHYELFEVLPALRAGVVVHFHDLPYPFEYSLKWVFDDNYSWNEAYAVRAFLMYNSDFSPFYSNSFIAMHEHPLVQKLYPTFPANPGSSFWIRKTA